MFYLSCTDSTIDVDVTRQEGIEIEGRVELNQDSISFINIKGTDIIASDPTHGIYSFM